MAPLETGPLDEFWTATRRGFLASSAMGLGSIALNVLESERLGAAEVHHRPRARSVIWLFMEGGPSHLDLVDPKPLLNRLAGSPLPPSFKEPITAMGEKGAPLLASPRKWKRCGQSGLWASDWIPHISQHMDDICVIHSCWTNGINHAGGVCQMNTCINVAGRPSLGSWIHYGLGTENEDLPGFVVMCDSGSRPVNGPRNWGSAFMPASHQGVLLRTDQSSPIANLQPPNDIPITRQQAKMHLLDRFNRAHAELHPEQSELAARIRSYELAFRMQAEAPEAVDLTREPEATHRLYGLDDPATSAMGKNCLLARRLVERGVRFIQLYSGTGSKWDSHSHIETNHSRLCRSMDRPVAGLLTDLKARGLLDSTLVVWGGEFGRTPMSEKGDGRDHNPTGFSIWMAGGGVRGGQTIGATDDLGLYAVEDKMHVKDIHASILWLLGLDNMKLTYNHRGRIERPTINEGRFHPQIVTG